MEIWKPGILLLKDDKIINRKTLNQNLKTRFFFIAPSAIASLKDALRETPETTDYGETHRKLRGVSYVKKTEIYAVF